MLPVGFEPKISAGERPQTYSLDHEAIGTDSVGLRTKQIIAKQALESFM